METQTQMQMDLKAHRWGFQSTPGVIIFIAIGE